MSRLVVHVDTAATLARRAEPGAADRAGHGGARRARRRSPAARGGALEARARAAGVARAGRSRFRGDLWPPGDPGPRAAPAAGAARACCCSTTRTPSPRGSSRPGSGRACRSSRCAASTSRCAAPLSRAKYAALRPRDRREPRDRLGGGAARHRRGAAAARLRGRPRPRARARRPGGARRARRARGGARRRQRGRAHRAQGPRDAARGDGAAAPAHAAGPARDRGEGELRGALEAQARALGLADRVVFAGFRRDLDRLLPAFSVFCLSSHLEGLGTSLLDAMAFGLPIVATAAGGIPEAVRGRRHGTAGAAARPRALAEALAEVLGDERAARRDWGAAGRRLFLERFTAERMVEETLRCRPGGRVKVRAILNPRAGVSRDEARRAAERGHPALERLRPVPSPRGPGTRPSSRAAAAAAGAELVLVGRRRRHGQRGRARADRHARRRSASCRSGSGNGLARALRIPLRPGARARRARDGRQARDRRGLPERAAVPERGRHRLRRGREPRLPRQRPARAAGAGCSATCA